jgi:hypothetical protein
MAVEYVKIEGAIVRHEQYKEPLEIYVRYLHRWEPYPELYGDLEFRRTVTAEETREWLQQRGMSAAEARKAVP